MIQVLQNIKNRLLQIIQEIETLKDALLVHVNNENVPDPDGKLQNFIYIMKLGTAVAYYNILLVPILFPYKAPIILLFFAICETIHYFPFNKENVKMVPFTLLAANLLRLFVFISRCILEPINTIINPVTNFIINFIKCTLNLRTAQLQLSQRTENISKFRAFTSFAILARPILLLSAIATNTLSVIIAKAITLFIIASFIEIRHSLLTLATGVKDINFNLYPATIFTNYSLQGILFMYDNLINPVIQESIKNNETTINPLDNSTVQNIANGTNTSVIVPANNGQWQQLMSKQNKLCSGLNLQ